MKDHDEAIAKMRKDREEPKTSGLQNSRTVAEIGTVSATFHNAGSMR